MGVRSIITAAADTVFPYIPKCVCCGVEKGVDDYLCPRCAKELEALKAGESEIDGINPGSPKSGAFWGGNAFSLYNYDGPVKSLVTGYKYSGKKWLSRFMGDVMAGRLASLPYSIDCVCNVPLHIKRRKSRGFDQSEEIARRISEVTDIPYIAALRRVWNTKTQTKLSEAQRRENIKGAFESAAKLSGNVLLIDDVLTTGATALECAAVLKEAGAGNVYIMTFARTVMRGNQRKTGLRRLINRFIKG